MVSPTAEGLVTDVSQDAAVAARPQEGLSARSRWRPPLWGAGCGLLAAISPGFAGVAVLAVILVRVVQRRAGPEDRAFLVGITISSLVIRLAVLAGISAAVVWMGRVHGSYPFEAPTLFHDSGYAAIRGWRFVDFVTNEVQYEDKAAYTFERYGVGLHNVLYGAFFALFGYSPFAVTALNGLIGVLTVLVGYALTRELAGRDAARLAAVLLAFFPSFVLWSATNLKDPLMMLLVTSLPWVWLRWHRTYRWSDVLLGAVIPLLMLGLRRHFLAGVVASVGCAVLFMVLYWVGRRYRGWLLLALGVLVVVSGRLPAIWDQLIIRFVGYHRGVVSTGGLTYVLFPPQVYDPSFQPLSVSLWELVRAYGLGWLHVLFEPFPWTVDRSPFSLLVLPQVVLLWYPLCVAAGIGAARMCRRRPGFGSLLALYVFLIGSVIVAGGGNVGTDFRMRDTIAPLLLCWAAIGLTRSPGASETL